MKDGFKSFLHKYLLVRLYAKDLTKLATLFSTDKWGKHWYASHYQHHFHPLRKKKLNILEIGVGGYEDQMAGGASLRMWKWYFPRSQIYGIDVFDKTSFEEHRITIEQGCQTDKKFLTDLSHKVGHFDIIIDDGSHVNSHVITSFQILFPLLRNQGIYVIEDTQTSYWSNEDTIKLGEWGRFNGDGIDLNNIKTSMGYFKSLIDGLNHQEFIKPGYCPSYYDKHIVAMHFYHNLIFLYKGNNDEGSNRVTNNAM